jgi:sugar (pentulose or hexulose) kinase
MMIRTPNAKFTFANFMRMQLYTAVGALKYGLDILFQKENVKVDKMFGHGGFFKTKDVGQRVMSAAMNAPVTVMKTAGEGGAWGIAVLAMFAKAKEDGETLDDYLNNKIFAGEEGITVAPAQADVDGFTKFMESYVKALPAERAAVENF